VDRVTTTGIDVVPARLRALGARAPWLVDAALIIAIVLLSSHGPDAGRTHAGMLWSLALALPLLARRRWPAATFAAIAVIALAQWFAGVRAFGDCALLVAFYAVAASQPVRTTVIAAVVLEIGVVLAVLRWTDRQTAVNAFVALSAFATAAGVMGINTRNRRALLASLEERASRLERERDQQGRLAAAAERSRIAREMHDIVAHNLSVMIALADGAGFAVRGAPDRAEEAMSRASRTGRQALTEMRRLLGVLRDEPGADASGPAPAQAAAALAPQPGLGELDALIEQVRGTGVPVRYEVTGEVSSAIPAGLQLAVYRIVQEALTNTLKHAGADAGAQVALAFGPEDVAVEIVDHGSGTAIASPEGGGLRGMRERAAVYDGTIASGPRPDGSGWRTATRLTFVATAAARA
jgi:signal transduction histidine kinase